MDLPLSPATACGGALTVEVEQPRRRVLRADIGRPAPIGTRGDSQSWVRIALPRHIREAARLEEGGYLEAELTESGTILLKPVNVTGREPTPEREAEILAAVDEARSFYAKKRRR